MITFLTTTERVRPPKQQHTTFRRDFADLFSNKAWLILSLIGILFVTFTTLKQGVTMYYFRYFVGDVNLAASYMSYNFV